jgi:U6 snRNA-associated Sm-like protein LSm2
MFPSKGVNIRRPLPMLFYEFFKSYVGKSLTVMLKTNVYLCGTLASIDPFLNIKLKDVRVLSNNVGLRGISVCSIRGTSIKYLLAEKREEVVDRVNMGSRLRLLLEKQ